MYYIYAGDVYCEDCGEAIRDTICSQAADMPDNPDDESTHDSDEYPKGPYGPYGPYGPCESDTPDHCACGEWCENAIELSDGSKIGVWLENEFTGEGVKYVQEAISEGGEVAELWAEFYCDCDLTN